MNELALVILSEAKDLNSSDAQTATQTLTMSGDTLLT
jgi:hypothetical protein